MTQETYSLHQIAAATGATEAQIHQWIHRGHFKPSHRPANGCIRKYTYQDALFAAVLLGLIKTGLSGHLASEVTGTVLASREKNKAMAWSNSFIRIKLNYEIEDNLDLSRPNAPNKKAA